MSEQVPQQKKSTNPINKTVQEMSTIGLILVTTIAVIGLVLALVLKYHGATDSLTAVAGPGIGALAILAGAKRDSDK